MPHFSSADVVSFANVVPAVMGADAAIVDMSSGTVDFGTGRHARR